MARFDAVPVTNLEDMRDGILHLIKEREADLCFLQSEANAMTEEINHRLAAHANEA